MLHPARLTHEQAADLVRDKPSFYRAMLGHGWFLPTEKSRACTLKFLKGMREGKYLRIERESIRFKVPPRRPTALKLHELCLEVLEEIVTDTTR